jgi:hypothetical protein
MKKIFFVAIIALMAITYACGPKETIFELTSEPVINAPYEGGSYIITYRLISEEENIVKAVADDKEMIKSIDTQTEGCIYIQVTENTTKQNRETTILVRYGSKCFDVAIEQAAKPEEPENPELPEEPEDPENPENPEQPEDPEDPEQPEDPETPGDDGYIINITANQLIGSYYGDNIIGNSSLYWIILSDNGIVDGATTPNSEYFRLDLLGPAPEDTANIRIPDGVYKLDVEEEMNEFSILRQLGNTDYTYIDNAGEQWQTPITYAELNVQGNNMFLMAVVEDKEYHVTFNGDYSLSYNKLSEHISTLTSDKEIDLSNCTGTVKNFGDYWKCGYCNWNIEFVCNNGLNEGTYFVLDLLTDTDFSGASGFEGTFRSTGFQEEDPTQPAWAPSTFISGFRISDVDNYMMGSMLVEHIKGNAVEQAPLHSGEITIKDNGDGTHTIIVNATDDKTPANKITLNWTGTLRK